MNKEFIPYEQALALKKFGFREDCFALYDESRNNRFEFINNQLAFNHAKMYYDSKNVYPCILCPTYSQAFRWFREKYGLYHVINMFGDWDKPQYSYIVSGKTMDNPAHMWHYEDVDSYEEAELACLNKLIEIVKTK
jgi:hypothetical protein